MTKGTGQISFLETWLWNSEKISGNLQSIFVDFLPSRTQRTDQCKKSQGEPSYIMRFKGPLLWINQALFRYYYNLNHLSSLKQRLAGIWKMAPTNQNTYIFPIDSSNAECTRKHSYISHIPYRFFTGYIFQNQKSSTQPLSIFSLMANPVLPAWACKTCACICRRSSGSHWWPLKSFWNINGPIESDRNEQGQTSPPKKGLRWIQNVDAQWIYWINVSAKFWVLLLFIRSS